MPHKFIISGGGTGGHIFPAVAIANELKLRLPDSEFLFIGANGRMEMEKIPQEGYKIVGLNISGLKRAFSLANLKVVWNFFGSYRKARRIIKEFNPDCVIGTGGYASLAVLYAAGRMKIPSLIWEGNGHPGLTNRLLSKRVSTICTGFDNMEKFFPAEKTIFTGNPVRSEILKIPAKSEGSAFFHFDPSKPTVLITGGSLGARTINRCIQQGYKEMLNRGIQVIWQTGKNFQPEVADAKGIYASPFLKEMNLAYAAADLVISRAGALSVSEIAVAGKPSILIPSPNVTDDHQTSNALKLSEKDAALLIKDQEADERLVVEAITLMEDKQVLDTMTQNVRALAQPEATNKIVDEVIKLIKR